MCWVSRWLLDTWALSALHFSGEPHFMLSPLCIRLSGSADSSCATSYTLNPKHPKHAKTKGSKFCKGVQPSGLSIVNVSCGYRQRVAGLGIFLRVQGFRSTYKHRYGKVSSCVSVVFVQLNQVTFETLQLRKMNVSLSVSLNLF